MRRLEDILGECLDALFQGVTVEECLARHPDRAQELAPLLRLAARIAHTPPLTMSPAGFERGRRRVRAAVAAVRAERSAVRRSTSDVPGVSQSDLGSGLRSADLEPTRRSSGWLDTLALAAITLAVVIVIVATSPVGSPLYPLRSASERVVAWLRGTTAERPPTVTPLPTAGHRPPTATPSPTADRRPPTTERPPSVDRRRPTATPLSAEAPATTPGATSTEAEMATATPSPTGTPTAIPLASVTPSASFGVGRGASPTAGLPSTATPVPTPTATETPAPTPTATLGTTPSPIPTSTPAATPSPTRTTVPTATASPIPTPLPTATPSPIPTSRPSPTATRTPLPPLRLVAERQLTHREYAVFRAWSPDGRRILFTVPRPPEAGSADDREIWVVERDGSARQQLGVGRWPTFSPDGEHVAYTAAEPGGRAVWVVPVTGGEPQHIADGATGRVFWPMEDRLLYATAEGLQAVSLTGPGVHPGAPELWVPLTGLVEGNPEQVQWSVAPDGRTAVFGLGSRWWLAHLRPRETAQIEALPVQVTLSHAWTRDGSAFAFAGAGESGSGLYLLATDEPAPRLLVPLERLSDGRGGGLIRSLTWAPDGRMLIVEWWSGSFDELPAIYLVDRNGRVQHLPNFRDHDILHWSPASGEIAFHRGGNVWVARVERPE